MGVLAKAFRPIRAQSTPGWAPYPAMTSGMPATYTAYAREGYQSNEIVYSAIELRATSAAEPRVIGRRKVKTASKQALRNALLATGASAILVNWHLNQLQEDITEHPALTLLNRPNPFMGRFEFWSTVIMHLDLAGNAFGVKQRPNGVGAGGGKPQEIWLLRPDFVKVIPGGDFIERYEYRPGGGATVMSFPPEDVIQWKTRNPFNQYYGMPPLMPVSGRLDIDNFMRDFVGAFFRNGGNPGAVLSVKQKLSQDAKDEIRAKHRTQFGGPAGWFELMVLDQAEATYTPMTASLGTRGLVVPELNAISEARLAMPFGVPLSILGGLTGQESSSYANKRQDWQVFWDLTLRSLYVALASQLNLSLLPDFPDLDEFLFDFTQVQALQEDVDKKHDRVRKDLAAGEITQEEARAETGRVPVAPDGYYLMPKGVTPTAAKDVPAMAIPAPDAPETARLFRQVLAIIEAKEFDTPLIEAPAIVDEVHCPTCNRWAGRNMNAGATAYCPKCKEFEVRDLTTSRA